jgi:putative transposase
MQPRCVIAGTTYLVTRRCSERRFFLRPGRKTNAIVRHAIFKAAHLWGVEVHAWTVMSNHLHLVVTDRWRELPSFMHALDLEISRALSPEIGRWGGLWEAGTYSAVALLDEEAILEKITYVLANPVRAGLVRRAWRWPGETSARLAFGDVVTARRPDTRFYRKVRGRNQYVLRLAPPPGMDPVDALVRVRARVQEIEKQVALTMRDAGRKWLGERKVMEQDPYDNPSSWEKRRGLSPTFASRDKWRRIDAAQRRGSWLTVYREVLARFRAGERNVVFPHGTWAMVRVYGCNCAPAPT